MTTRRGFLTLAGSAIVLPRVGFTDVADPKTVWFFQAGEACSDSTAFGEHLAGHTVCTPAATRYWRTLDDIVTLDRALDHFQPDLLIGLTRSAEQLVLEQTVTSCGYGKVFIGKHSYRDRALEHELHGNSAFIRALSRRLATDPSPWPHTLAALLPQIDSRLSETVHVRAIAAGIRPPTGPGFLTSWAYLGGA